MSPEAFLPVAFVLGYLLGSIPLRADPDGLRRHPGPPLDRLRPISGANNVLRTGHQGPRRGDAVVRHAQGHRPSSSRYYGGPDAAMLAALGAFHRHLFPGLAQF